MRDARLSGVDLPEGTPPWLGAFVREALLETDTLRETAPNRPPRLGWLS